MIGLLLLATAIVIAFYVLRALGRIFAYCLGLALVVGIVMMGLVAVDKVLNFVSPGTHLLETEPVKVAHRLAKHALHRRDANSMKTRYKNG